MTNEAQPDSPRQLYRNVPAEWLPHLGKLAVLSTGTESVAFYIAGLLHLPRPKNGRTPGFKKECEAIRIRLSDPWFPRIISQELPAWRTATTEWTKRAPSVLDRTRNLYLHAAYAHLWNGDSEEPVMLNRTDSTVLKKVTLDDLTEAVDELAAVEVDGERLWFQLRNLAARIHEQNDKIS